MERYKVLRIEEEDFGCEGRPDHMEPMVDVILVNEKEETFRFQEKDQLLYQRKINEGDFVFIENNHLKKDF